MPTDFPDTRALLHFWVRALTVLDELVPRYKSGPWDRDEAQAAVRAAFLARHAAFFPAVIRDVGGQPHNRAQAEALASGDAD
ncbi:MAG: hypothetical protein IPM13_05415 [Phycisphaerales bacterium]|nr:hypothetical protein [Phycisphaerales bacterium]